MDWSKHFGEITKKVYEVVFLCFNRYRTTALEKLGQLRDSSVSETRDFLQNYFSQYQWFVFDVAILFRLGITQRFATGVNVCQRPKV